MARRVSPGRRVHPRFPVTRFGLFAILASVGLLCSGGGSAALSSQSSTHDTTPMGSAGLQAMGVGSENSAAHANLLFAGPSAATNISPAFWGVDVLANYPFNGTNATHLARTPVSYLRFPGGALGEEFNYTSGVITRDTGATYNATTSTRQFVTSCNRIHCHAILQLPAEINQSATAAYYAAYVVQALHFQPAYWEIGNTVPGWSHFGVPWSNWSSQARGSITPLVFAHLVGTYISAVKTVDPNGSFIALGAGMGQPGYDKSWITNLTQVDGPNLSGISVHSYTMGAGPANPTWPELLANLNGPYSLPAQVNADRAYIAAVCPSCSISIFVTEANAAEVGSFTPLVSTFAGTLYVAADTAQALNLRLTNLDWFCFDCNYSGSWEGPSNLGMMQYTLYERMMTRLGTQLLASNLTGPSTLYAAVTYGPQGYALLFVNVNMTQSVSINIGHAGVALGGTADRERWSNGSADPHSTTLTLGKYLLVPALTVEIITF